MTTKISPYLEIAKKNLLFYSTEKVNYKRSKLEWYFTGEVIDNNNELNAGDERPSCELCEKKDLRWQFTIINKTNQNQLRVGSTCIKQFDIVLIDSDGNELYGEERNKSIERKIRDKIKNVAFSNTLSVLESLIIKDNTFSSHFQNAISQLKEHKSFSPRILSVLLWRFKENNIDTKKLYLKISLNKPFFIEDLKKLGKFKYTQIRPYLTKAKQQEYDLYYGL
jgi:hypothetical protein